MSVEKDLATYQYLCGLFIKQMGGEARIRVDEVDLEGHMGFTVSQEGDEYVFKLED